MMRWLCLIALGLLVGVQGCSTADDAAAVKHTEDSVEVVRENLSADKALMLDVREAREWEAGHLAGARLVPLSGLKANVAAQIEGVPKDKILYLHCGSGKRVLQAASLLRSQGYDARPLPWGFDALVKQGFEQAPATDK